MNKLATTSRRAIYLLSGQIDKMVDQSPHMLVLCYHSIADDNWLYSINKKMFIDQLDFLAEKYTFISLSDVEKVLDGTMVIHRPSVAITFDDGYKDITQVVDVVAKHNIHPTVFTLSDSQNVQRHELDTNRELLSTAEIIGLRKTGWNIGSHGATHSDFGILDSHGISREVASSKIKLERDLGFSIDYFAFPKGVYNNQILEEVKKSGYKLGLSMDPGYLAPSGDRFKLPRIGVDRTHSLTEFKSMLGKTSILVRKTIINSPLVKFV
jgi:peptidoglycan/xylan/chitin deacetylase (PgdA/CDA1 family)